MMDEAQKYFVSTIVGQPQRLVLGRQVRFDMDPTTRVPVGLRRQLALLSGKLHEVTDGVVASLKAVKDSARGSRQLATPAGTVMPFRWDSKPLKVLGVVAAVSVVGAVIYQAIGWQQEFEVSQATQPKVAAGAQQAASVPAAPASTPMEIASAPETESALPLERGNAPGGEGSGMVVVNEPAPSMPVPAPVLAAKEGTPLDRKVATVVLTPAPSKPEAAPKSQPAAVDKPRDEKPDRAVIVDVTKAAEERRNDPVVKEETPQGRQFATPVEAKPAQQAAPVTTTANAPSAQPTATSAQKPKAERVTVVDISPDASFVLITNPETRLPQRYKAGQRIWTGETIKSIDPKAGTLVLDARTVSME